MTTTASLSALLLVAFFPAACSQGDSPPTALEERDETLDGQEPSATDPAAVRLPTPVDDLSVAGASGSSVTLAWTEVEDGLEAPASYEVRYALTPIGYGWGRATAATEGSCALPVQGSEVGVTIACAVTGLARSTSYDFQLVAFRTEADGTRTYSESLSNVATATTTAGAPGTVTDLAVASTTSSSATLEWTGVDDGAGGAALYEVRHAPTPIGLDWGGATILTEGECALPVEGGPAGSTVACTATGLGAGESHDFQLVAFRYAADGSRVYSDGLSNVATGVTSESSGEASGGSGAVECAAPDPAWIWCDDFEEDRLGRYFEYSDRGGSFQRHAGVGVGGSQGMRARFQAGQVDAGGLRLAFGRTPQGYFEAVDNGTRDYREVYWRIYLRHQDGWVGGGGDKLSRATAFADPDSWAQSMIAHVWSGSGSTSDVLILDPASGTDEWGSLQTTKYNDFANLRWLGARPGSTPIFDASHVGEWYCIEARARLNDPGSTNGVFELWIDGSQEVRIDELNWSGSFTDYGINAVFLENYWNAGSPQTQERYMDRFIVSTARIGC